MSNPCPICAAKGRSSEDHRRFFALIAAAFANWPEGHDFQPTSAEHLRAWLLCKAGHKEVQTISLPEVDNPIQMAAFMGVIEEILSDSDRPRFGRWSGSSLNIFKAKSVKFSKARQSEFNKIRDAVSEIIEAEIGVPADKLLKEHERAA